MKWTEQDELDLRLGIELALPYKELAYILDRTYSSVLHKVSKLGISNRLTEVEYRNLLPKGLEPVGVFMDTTTKILHKHSCGYEWLISPSKVLNGRSCPKCAGNLKKSTKQYISEVPKEFTVLEEYKGYDTKILHGHSCGYTWSVSPSSLLKNRGCPNCSKSGFNPNIPGLIYLVHFYTLNMYKIGITNRTVKERFRGEPYPYEIILYRKFDKGRAAKKLEAKWLDNTKNLKYNSGKLKSGNTETFCLDIKKIKS